MSALREYYGRPARSVRKGIRRKIANMRKRGMAEEQIRKVIHPLRERVARDHEGKPPKERGLSAEEREELFGGMEDEDNGDEESWEDDLDSDDDDE